MGETLQEVMSGGNPKPKNSVPESAVVRKRGRPGPKKKVEDEVIVDYLRQGYSQADIARHVGLSDQAISKRVKTLGHRAVAAMFHADSNLWGVELKTMTQLAELNSRLMLAATKKGAKTEELIASAREIRQQLDFQMRFQDALKVQQRFEEFRETVLTVLDELGQDLGVDVREKVMVAFKRRTEARLMLTRPRVSEGRGEKYVAPQGDPDLDEKVRGTTGPPIEAEYTVAEEPGEEDTDDDDEEGAEGPVPVAEEELVTTVDVDEEDEEGGVEFDL